MRRASVMAGLVIGILLIAGAAVNAGNNPSFDLKWYGHFKLDGSFDQNLTSHGNFVMWVQPRMYNKDDEQFNMTANATRFGFEATGKGYNNLEVGGKLEFDLYAGVSASSIDQNAATLQLRHAYLTIQSGSTKLLAGQSFDLVSPLNPSTLNYSALWGCGNIGYRRPQVSLWHSLRSNDDQTHATLAGGFFRTIGSDLTPTFSLAAGELSEGEDDGTDAGIPSFQGLFDVWHNLPSGGYLRVGVSGMWGKLKAETNLGNSQKYESWAAVGHLMVSFPNDFGFAGEAFTGSNLGTYFGGILRNSSIEGVRAIGGWASAWVKPSPKVKFAAGFGMDDPDDNDFTTGRSQNVSYFGNVRYNIVPQAEIGLEVSHWETKYKNAGTAKNLRAQTAFILNF